MLKSVGRGDWIRTSDLLNPIQVRYRTALRPDDDDSDPPERIVDLARECTPLTLGPGPPSIRGRLAVGVNVGESDPLRVVGR